MILRKTQFCDMGFFDHIWSKFSNSHYSSQFREGSDSPAFGYPPIKNLSPSSLFNKNKHAHSIKLYILEIPLSKCLQVQQNLEVDPLSNTGARCCTVLASIAMENIKEIHSSISEINKKTLKFGYLIPC